MTAAGAGRVITAYRPDPVVDPEFEGFADNVAQFGALTGEDTSTWRGYLAAHRNRRAFFKTMGATSTDHGHPTAQTSDLDESECQRLLDRALAGTITSGGSRGVSRADADRDGEDEPRRRARHADPSRAASATTTPRCSATTVATRAPTSRRRPTTSARCGRCSSKLGNARGLTIILFTLDETSYARELAPLAGHYPVLKLGPPWWFHDSPEGMLRFREQTTETAGFYNTVGFNDDTRAFLSIPARHDVARRIDCRFLATLVPSTGSARTRRSSSRRSSPTRSAKKAYKL